MALNISKKTAPADVDSSAKGDLIVNSGTDIVSLPVGTDNQIIIANALQTTGIEWVDANSIVAPVTGLFSPSVTLGQNYPLTAAGNQDDIFNAIATDNNTVAWSDPVLSGDIQVSEYTDAEVSPLGTPATTNINALTDQNTSTGETTANNQNIVIDFITYPVSIETVALYGTIGSYTWTMHTSVDGTTWVNQGNIVSNNGTWNTATVSSPTAARYFRLENLNGTNSHLREIEVYGSATIATVNSIYDLSPGFNSKFIEFGDVVPVDLRVDIDTNSDIGDVFSTVIANNTSGDLNLIPLNSVTLSGDTTAKPGEVLYIYKVDTDRYYSVRTQTPSLDTKGQLLTHDGIEEVNLAAGSDGQVLTIASATSEGLEWKEIGGLNLTETKQAIGNATFKPEGSGTYTTGAPPGVFDFIGTDEDTVAYSNVSDDDEVDFLLDGFFLNGRLVNKSFAGSTTNLNNGGDIVVDLKRNAYINPTAVGINVSSGTGNVLIEASNNAISWDTIGTANITGDQYHPVSTVQFYRYFRFTNQSGNFKSWFELEIYGYITPAVPNYDIVDADNNKLLLVGLGNSVTVDLPTGIGANGFTCQITPTNSAALPITINPEAGVTFIGQSFTIDNVGEVATIYQVATDIYVVSVSRGKLPLSLKGDLLTHDGSEPVVQTIGADNTVLTADSAEASGVAWKDVDTIVSTPFTAQRLDLASTLQLTASNARYLYLAATGGTQDVILTDPPSANDFFYIVNRDGANPIQIKETAAGGVVQTINSTTPIAQCHWDGITWQIITLGNI